MGKHLPPTIRRLIGALRMEKEIIGESGAEVYRVGNRYYLKVQPFGLPEPLSEERNKLVWLDGKLPVPKVVGYAVGDDGEYLLTTAVDGVHAASPAVGADPKFAVHALAAGLKQIHSVSLKACPFDETLTRKLTQAKERVMCGTVDETNFDESRAGKTASVLLEELVACRPDEEDLVFTHGDYCMPNILLNENGISGFIDWGRAGIADRYQDLGLAARSIVRNYGESWVEPFFYHYGIDRPEPEKIDYYQLLDEFF
ncbi:MAG TPA: APH(3') family aminoglycoside O-phosphotransferase [Bacillales bacterium]|nr:APH(3') family aminoglycoside O-phosphotransferase [Bacillales bacterium]